MKIKDLYTTNDIKENLGYTQSSTVYRLCKRYGLGELKGHQYLLTKEEYERFKILTKETKRRPKNVDKIQ